jgi:RimJ/RimL family protein N-acetyltransferase
MGNDLGPRLDTERLILRPPRAADFDAWAAMADDEVAMRYIGGRQPRSVAWRAFLSAAGAWAIQGFGMFSVIERGSDRWIGRIGPITPEGWPGTEVGWGLARDAWGQGYAVEAASAAMDFAVDTLGWTEVIHCIDPQNASSVRVAERLGSAILRRGRLPAPIDEDIDVWGQTSIQWKARRG